MLFGHKIDFFVFSKHFVKHFVAFAGACFGKSRVGGPVFRLRNRCQLPNGDSECGFHAPFLRLETTGSKEVGTLNVAGCFFQVSASWILMVLAKSFLIVMSDRGCKILVSAKSAQCCSMLFQLNFAWAHGHSQEFHSCLSGTILCTNFLARPVLVQADDALRFCQKEPLPKYTSLHWHFLLACLNTQLCILYVWICCFSIWLYHMMNLMSLWLADWHKFVVAFETS